MKQNSATLKSLYNIAHLKLNSGVSVMVEIKPLHYVDILFLIQKFPFFYIHVDLVGGIDKSKSGCFFSMETGIVRGGVSF